MNFTLVVNTSVVWIAWKRLEQHMHHGLCNTLAVKCWRFVMISHLRTDSINFKRVLWGRNFLILCIKGAQWGGGRIFGKLKYDENLYHRLTFHSSGHRNPGNISSLSSCWYIRCRAESSDWWVNNLEWERWVYLSTVTHYRLWLHDWPCPALVVLGECGKAEVSQPTGQWCTHTHVPTHAGLMSFVSAQSPSTSHLYLVTFSNHLFSSLPMVHATVSSQFSFQHGIRLFFTQKQVQDGLIFTRKIVG